MSNTLKHVIDILEEGMKGLENKDPLDLLHKVSEELDFLRNELKKMAEGSELPHIANTSFAKGRQNLAQDLLEIKREPGK